MLLRQLEYMVAVADEGGFTGGAEYLRVSQPALSSSIMKLERELGIPIFRRRGHSFDGLTPDGERLLGWARKVLANHDALLGEAQSLREGLSGTLRLGATPAGIARVPLIAETFHYTHSGVSVQIRENLTPKKAHRLLTEFHLDAVIGIFPVEELVGIDCKPLYQEEFVVVASPGVLPEETTTITWEDMTRLSLVMLDRNTALRRRIDRILATHNITLSPGFEVESPYSVTAQLLAGDHASVMPTTFLHHFAHDMGFHTAKLSDPSITAQVSLATIHADTLPVITRAFVQTVANLHLHQLTP